MSVSSCASGEFCADSADPGSSKIGEVADDLLDQAQAFAPDKVESLQHSLRAFAGQDRVIRLELAVIPSLFRNRNDRALRAFLPGKFDQFFSGVVRKRIGNQNDVKSAQVNRMYCGLLVLRKYHLPSSFFEHVHAKQAEFAVAREQKHSHSGILDAKWNRIFVAAASSGRSRR